MVFTVLRKKRRNTIRIIHLILPRSATGIFLILLSYAPLHQLISQGILPASHERERYAILGEYFFRAVSAGDLFPRWLPDLNGGFRYPTFVFYPPGFFFLYLPFRFLAPDPISALHGSIYTLFLIGATGAYFLGKTVSNRIGGLFAAAMFLLTPYIYVNLYVRGDLSELTAMLLTPWPLYFALALSRQVNEDRGQVTGYMFGLALSTAAIIFSHPLTSLI